MSDLILPLAFWCKDRADAERQALAWAALEPKILTATVSEATQVPLHPDRWTVTLDVTWVPSDAGETLEMGL